RTSPAGGCAKLPGPCPRRDRAGPSGGRSRPAVGAHAGEAAWVYAQAHAPVRAALAGCSRHGAGPAARPPSPRGTIVRHVSDSPFMQMWTAWQTEPFSRLREMDT